MSNASDLSTPVIGGQKKTNLSADALVKNGHGYLTGFFCSKASSSPKVTLYDNSAASGTLIINDCAPVAGVWYSCPVPFQTGLYCDVSGSVDITISFT